MSEPCPVRAQAGILRWLPFALIGAALLPLARAVLGGETLFWGLPTLQFYPWREFAFAELHAGRLPAWNPYLGAGAPLLANYQTAIFYPPNWLILVLPGPLAMSLVALVHVLWAALGMWRLAGALGLALLIALGYRLTRRPWGDQPGCVVRVLALQPIAADRARALAWLAGLLPMTYPALIAAVRLALPSGLEAQVQANLLPDPWILPFDLPAALLTGLAFTLLCLGSLILLPANSSQRPTLAPDRALALVILVTILLWAARLYVGQRTAGVSASDPYAYAQMAVDVAGVVTEVSAAMARPKPAELKASPSEIDTARWMGLEQAAQELTHAGEREMAALALSRLASGR